METARIPGTDLQPTRLALGTWAIGGWMWGGTDEGRAIETIHAALDQGVTCVDTAPVYGFGRAEEIVGRALADGGRRDGVVLSTKVGLNWTAGGQPYRDATPARINAEIDASRRRLQTDVIDVYHVHWPDPATPVEDTAAALKGLLDAGRIRAVAVSNFSPEQMERFRTVAPLHVVQPPYNLFERGIERDVLAHCRTHDIATFTYGALCRGLLSGRMGAETTFQGDDLRRNDPKFQGARFRQYLTAVERLDALARERYDRRVIDLALRWLLDQPGVSVALWGARRPEQLEPLRAVEGWSLDAAAKAEIDRILAETVSDPVGPEFMAPPTREAVAA